MISIKTFVYDFLILLSNFLVKHTKKKDIILFNSFPDFSDNAIYLYRYIMKNRPDLIRKYKLVWVVKKIPIDGIDLEMNVVLKKSIKGFWLMLHSKYIVITHNYYYGYVSSKGQTIINLWHGCGFKGMKNEDIKYSNGDCNIVTSDEFISSHSRAFKIPSEKILVTGLPRNDVLFDNDNKALHNLGIEKSNYKKVIIWMPTYRKAKMGHDSLDGDANSFGAYSMSEKQFERINSILVSNRYLLIIKPHPMDSATTKNAKRFSNIRYIINEDLEIANVELYSLLAETDALLSDYSSVIVDYLLLDRPITLVMSDADSYKNTRGFTFENMEEYTPGPIISSFDDLYSYFEQMDMIDGQYEEKRREVTKRLHAYIDGNSSKRVCEAIWGECN